SLLLADALLVLLMFLGSFSVVVGLRILVVMAAAFLALAALVKYRKSALVPALRAPTLLAAIYLGVGAASIYFLFVALQVRHPEFAADTRKTLEFLAAASPYDGNWWLLLFTVNAGISGILGAIGLLKVMSFRAQRATRPAGPPSLPGS